MKIDAKKRYRFATEEDYLKFLKDAEEQGCRWACGEKPTEWKPALTLRKKCYELSICFDDNMVEDMLFSTQTEDFNKAEYYEQPTKKRPKFELDHSFVEISNAKRLLLIEKDSIDTIVGDLRDIPNCITIVYKKGHKPELVDLVEV